MNELNKGKMKASPVQKATVFVAVITSFVTSFVGSALNLSVPDMSADFGVGAAAIGWVITAYMLPVAAFSVPFGKIADIIGRKSILVSGIAVFTAGLIVSAAAPTFSVMIVSRVIQALGAAMIFATNHAILVSEFPGSERGRVLGYALAATYTGLSAGPVFGGIINHSLGWRAIFIITAVAGLVALIAAVRKLPSRKVEGAVLHFDKVGNVLYILMIVLTIYGLNEFSNNAAAAVLIPAGILLGVLFVKREKKEKFPLVDVRLFAENMSYTLSNLAALLNYAATFAIGYLLSIYLQVIAGFTSQTAGIILIAQPLVMAVFSPYMGKLSDRVSPYKLATAGMTLCGISLLLLAFINITTPVWLIISILLIAGCGFALFSSPNTNAVMSCVDKSSYGVASSVLSTMRNVGHVTGMAIVTILVHFSLGDVAFAQADPETLVRTMRISYAVFAFICVAGIFCSGKRGKR
ncbi:MAG: MFS transporter [Firmicutes bacterium]|nr:MFS transporter [Bacillota bacterium]